jgi:hypothetical protein
MVVKMNDGGWETIDDALITFLTVPARLIFKLKIETANRCRSAPHKHGDWTDTLGTESTFVSIDVHI